MSDVSFNWNSVTGQVTDQSYCHTCDTHLHEQLDRDCKLTAGAAVHLNIYDIIMQTYYWISAELNIMCGN
jgi:hypothetical protein